MVSKPIDFEHTAKATYLFRIISGKDISIRLGDEQSRDVNKPQNQVILFMNGTLKINSSKSLGYNAEKNGYTEEIKENQIVGMHIDSFHKTLFFSVGETQYGFVDCVNDWIHEDARLYITLSG